MRRLLELSLIFLILSSCSQKSGGRMEIDFDNARQMYAGQKISITPDDFSIEKNGREIVIAPGVEGKTYTISGYFNGQIEVKTRNTVLKLENAFLENTGGKSAIKCLAKTEISAAQGTENYVVSTGRSFSKSGAVSAKKNLVLGGSGALYVSGNVCHGVEADEAKIKGSGKFVIQGTRGGSAISCESFSVEGGKTFKCYLLNSKNGLKADGAIAIKSGNFFIYDNGTALKTNRSKKPSAKPHSITLSGGAFRAAGNGTLAATDDGAFSTDGAEIVEEE